MRSETETVYEWKCNRKAAAIRAVRATRLNATAIWVCNKCVQLGHVSQLKCTGCGARQPVTPSPATTGAITGTGTPPSNPAPGAGTIGDLDEESDSNHEALCSSPATEVHGNSSHATGADTIGDLDETSDSNHEALCSSLATEVRGNSSHATGADTATAPEHIRDGGKETPKNIPSSNKDSPVNPPRKFKISISAPARTRLISGRGDALGDVPCDDTSHIIAEEEFQFRRPAPRKYNLELLRDTPSALAQFKENSYEVDDAEEFQFSRPASSKRKVAALAQDPTAPTSSDGNGSEEGSAEQLPGDMRCAIRRRRLS